MLLFDKKVFTLLRIFLKPKKFKSRLKLKFIRLLFVFIDIIFIGKNVELEKANFELYIICFKCITIKACIYFAPTLSYII